MRAVEEHGRPLVDDPARLDGVTTLGLDETSFLKATRVAPTRYVTGLVDLEGGRLLDVVADRTRAAVDGWLGARPHAWLAQVGTVALDPWRGYASALVTPLGHARVVVDHFHAVRLANAVVDQVRRRIQQATLGHRGRKRDPLYRIRKLLLVAAEQLTSRGRVRLRAGLATGDPTGEVAAAWQGKELLRMVYAASDLADARAALDRFYRWADGVGVAELSRLARTVRACRPRSSPSTPPVAAPTGRPRPSTCWSRRSSGSGTASVTSSTTGCGCCCTAASGGSPTRPRGCEVAPHAWWRRAACSYPPWPQGVTLAVPGTAPCPGVVTPVPVASGMRSWAFMVPWLHAAAGSGWVVDTSARAGTAGATAIPAASTRQRATLRMAAPFHRVGSAG
jgi:Transposase